MRQSMSQNLTQEQFGAFLPGIDEKLLRRVLLHNVPLVMPEWANSRITSNIENLERKFIIDAGPYPRV